MQSKAPSEAAPAPVRNRPTARCTALVATLAGVLWCAGAAHAQNPVTLWMTNIQGYGQFPPAWYPMLGRTPAEACEKYVAASMQQEARTYESYVQQYGAEWVCPAIFQMVSSAPGCNYRAFPPYRKSAPEHACTTFTVEQNLPNIGLSFPVADSKAAGEAPYGACTRANPVNLGNGNKLQAEADFQGSGTLPLQFLRTYNSRGVLALGRIGRGWRHNFESTVGVDEFNGRTMAHRPNGAVYVFARAGSQWIPDADIPDRLDRVLDANSQPAGWRYRAAGADDRVEVYDRDGRLTAIEDRTGRTLSLQYTPHPVYGMLLSAVVDPFGRALAFGHDGAGRIDRITDSAGGIHRYEYDAQGNLAVVTRPDLTTRRYHYEKSGDAPMDASGYVPETALTGITDENGARFASFDYDEQGRTTLSKHALEADRVTFSHAGNAVIVTDALGATRTYSLQDVLGTKKNTTTSGDPGCPLGFAARTFDSNGMPSSRTDWNGNVTQTTRDARGLEALRVEAAGTAQARTITTEWHPFYRLPTRVAEPAADHHLRLRRSERPEPGQSGERTVEDGQGTPAMSPERRASRRRRLGQRVVDIHLQRQRPGADGRWSAHRCCGRHRLRYHPNDDPDPGKRGNVATVTNALGHVTQITAYNAHGQPLTIVDPNGLATQLAYDVRQRLTSRNVGGELDEL